MAVDFATARVGLRDILLGMPRGFDFGDGKGLVAAHGHQNPDGSMGGWVADTAYVAETVFMDSTAAVFGRSIVLDEVEIKDFAMVCGDTKISGKAQLKDFARVSGSARIEMEAKIGGSATIEGQALVSGCAVVEGRADVHGQAIIRDNGKVLGNAIVFGEAVIGYRTVVQDKALVGGDSKLFLDETEPIAGSTEVVSGTRLAKNYGVEQLLQLDSGIGF